MDADHGCGSWMTLSLGWTNSRAVVEWNGHALWTCSTPPPTHCRRVCLSTAKVLLAIDFIETRKKHFSHVYNMVINKKHISVIRALSALRTKILNAKIKRKMFSVIEKEVPIFIFSTVNKLYAYYWGWISSSTVPIYVGLEP